MARATKKSENTAHAMRCVSLVCGSPDELAAELNDLLTHFDVYEIQNTTATSGGRPQFIAYVYGRDKITE